MNRRSTATPLLPAGLVAGLAAGLVAGLLSGATAAAADIVRYKLPGSDFPIALAVEIPAGTKTVYVSGLGPDIVDRTQKPDSPAAYGDTRAQALNTLQKIETTLRSMHLGMKDVVKMTVFLVGDPARRRHRLRRLHGQLQDVLRRPGASGPAGSFDGQGRGPRQSGMADRDRSRGRRAAVTGGRIAGRTGTPSGTGDPGTRRARRRVTHRIDRAAGAAAPDPAPPRPIACCAARSIRPARPVRRRCP